MLSAEQFKGLIKKDREQGIGVSHIAKPGKSKTDVGFTAIYVGKRRKNGLRTS